MMRPPRPQNDDCNDVDKHRNDDDGHYGEVETNAGDSDGANCYLAPFDNTTIRYVVAAMV